MNHHRSSPISGTSDFLGLRLTEREYRMLLDARHQGIKRGVSLLANMKCDWEAVLWQGAGSAAALAAANVYPEEAASPQLVARMSTNFSEEAVGGLSNFLMWALKAVEKKLLDNAWVQRLLELLGLGMSFVVEVIKKHLLSGDALKALVPFYGPIKSFIVGGVKAYEARQDSVSLDRLRAAAPQIGSGIPTVMFRAFDEFLVQELAASVAKSAYNFGKGITSLLVGIFAAPASSALEFVMSVVQAVASFFYMILQAIMFQKTTDKCREWEQCGDIPLDLDVSKAVAGCPFVGCLFFGAANYIGHFNLTAMVTAEKYINGVNLIKAVSDVSAVQRIACQYVVRTEFPFQVIDEKRYGWIVKMMKGYANTAPRSEFVTDDASVAVKFVHYGKKVLRVGKKVGMKVFGFLA